jgi:hypothetical protein
MQSRSVQIILFAYFAVFVSSNAATAAAAESVQKMLF